MEEIRWQQRFANFQKSMTNLTETFEYIEQVGLNKFNMMAVIQAFEIAYELSWKTMKNYLEYNGIKATSPREVIKEAFTNNIVTEGQEWINMLEARNKTSHTYQEPLAAELTNQITNTYYKLLKNLETFLQGKING